MKYLISLLFLFFINITSASVTTDLSAPSFEFVDSHGKIQKAVVVTKTSR